MFSKAPSFSSPSTMLLFLLVACIGIHATSAINCYVCDASDSLNPFQCGEWFERYDEPDSVPQNCSNVHEARFCIKHVGRFEGGIGAKRFCSSKDLGNYCDYVRNKGDRMDYRSCIYTCSSDGCNGALGVVVFQSHHMVAVQLLTLGFAAISLKSWFFG